MLRPIQFWRVLKINLVLLRHAFTPHVIGTQTPLLRVLTRLNPIGVSQRKYRRGESVRRGFEKLGPIFVKFGQLLSTRQDLFPDDVIEDLSHLQDRVPPFSNKKARTIIETELKQSIDTAFAEFNQEPMASASIAQVHAAKLHDGSDVIVKVLRPNVERTIRDDIAILYQVARIVERCWSQGKRLHLVDLVKEFEQTILDELDLMREAANASQLRRNFLHSDIMYVPAVHWRLTTRKVMVMERIYGLQISDKENLHLHGTNMKTLAENGVTIFFTQVFRDSFFHADMHPGNIFVDVSDPQHPKYLGVDFGIMGTLGPEDQHYLAANLLAFFNRDYRQVAVLHIESGWVPADTRVDQFESAMRTVCEPIFELPLAEISFGKLLLRLFQTAERFKMEVQPQLMLLQKTLLAIEGLGRQLYPELDLWATAKPFLTQWMREQRGFKRLGKEALSKLPDTLESLIQSPTAVHQLVRNLNFTTLQRQQNISLESIPNTKRSFLFGCGTIALAGALMSLFWQHAPIATWQWTLATVGAGGFLLGWLLPRRVLK